MNGMYALNQTAYGYRPYQQAAKDAVLAEWDKGVKRTLLVMPTGTGKTIVLSSIVAERANQGKGRSLILAHREELLAQAADKLKTSFGMDSALEMAKHTSLGSDAPVTVGSVQSMTRKSRLDKFPQDYFSTIVVDEAHHALSDSYRKILEHFPDADVLGVTATPDRGDKRYLGEYFQDVAYEYSMQQAIREGYLCPVRIKTMPIKIDLRKAKVRAGDYVAEDVATAISPYLAKIAKCVAEECKDRKTVVFLPLIKMSVEFCEKLKKRGVKAAEVNGNTPDRQDVLDAFARGEYDVLCNSMLLTEGWDCPSVDCVIVLRPTNVRALYQQMIGRGTRPYPGKKDLLVLDFLWLTKSYDLCVATKLFGETAEANKPHTDDPDNPFQGSHPPIDVFGNMSRKLIDILDFHSERCREEYSLKTDDIVNYTPRLPWEAEAPTRNQLAALARFGVDTGIVDSKGFASKLLNRLIKRRNVKLSTVKQIRLLERYGFTDAETWSMTTASKAIDVIAQNKWKLNVWQRRDIRDMAVRDALDEQRGQAIPANAQGAAPA